MNTTRTRIYVVGRFLDFNLCFLDFEGSTAYPAFHLSHAGNWTPLIRTALLPSNLRYEVFLDTGFSLSWGECRLTMLSYELR